MKVHIDFIDYSPNLFYEYCMSVPYLYVNMRNTLFARKFIFAPKKKVMMKRKYATDSPEGQRRKI